MKNLSIGDWGFWIGLFGTTYIFSILKMGCEMPNGQRIEYKLPY